MLKQTCWAVVATLCCSCPLFAITANLGASQDNTLYEDLNGTLSNGAGMRIFAGTNGNFRVRRALLEFDIAAEIPSSATITGAALTLNLSKAANINFADALELRRVATDWGEGDSNAAGSPQGNGGEGAGVAAEPGDATWKHSFSPNTDWANLGGDFLSTVSATENVSGIGSYTWSAPQLVADVQDMLDSPQTNFGWILFGNEANAATAKQFNSRESLNPPVLTIDYDLAGLVDADFDGDSDIDVDDLNDWIAAYSSNTNGDADGDDDSDGADYLAWQQAYTGPGELQALAVPEPTSATLALACFALAALNRRGGVSGHQNGQK
ncbi:MAG: DNRLRE domain-containing protein [Bythopirellula sp.]